MAVVAGLIAALVSIVVAPASHACSCVGQDAEDQIAAATVIFVGTALERIDDDGAGPAELTFEVERVYLGDALPRTTMVATMEGTACDLDFVPGVRYLVVGVGRTERVAVPACGGSQEVVEGGLTGPGAEILQQVGAGEPPGRAAEEPTTAPVWPAVLMVGAGALLAAALLVGARRRSS